MTDIQKLIQEEKHDFDSLVNIMALLRSENGCPWDREQDHHSIRKDFIEETYEVIEAIDTDDPVLLCEELGDVLLQVVFHAQIEKETGTFDISDVIHDICAKLILRHPHVFGAVEVHNSEEVLQNWEIIKSEEKQRKTLASSMNAIPPALPALMRASKIGNKAAKVHFDFDSPEHAFEKIEEETKEVCEELYKENRDLSRLGEEIGDLLFSVVNFSRLLGIDSEQVLNQASDKFVQRFTAMEQKIEEKGLDIHQMTLAEMDYFWEIVKKSI